MCERGIVVCLRGCKLTAESHAYLAGGKKLKLKPLQSLGLSSIIIALSIVASSKKVRLHTCVDNR